jgi:hypothetical protein
MEVLEASKGAIFDIGVYVSGFVDFIESAIVGPNILVSYSIYKVSIIVLSLQQILNCFMMLAACLSQTDATKFCTASAIALLV